MTRVHLPGTIASHAPVAFALEPPRIGRVITLSSLAGERSRSLVLAIELVAEVALFEEVDDEEPRAVDSGRLSSVREAGIIETGALRKAAADKEKRGKECELEVTGEQRRGFSLRFGEK
ncbi:hypothetical protein KCU83_g652, partial [Aureobasidium melanogenum]